MVQTLVTLEPASTATSDQQRHLRPLDITKKPAGKMLPRMSDEEIIGLVHQALHSCGYQPFRNLKTYCDNGRVTLQGRLPSYYLKQVAQTAVLAVAGVRDIDNDVRVITSW